MNSTKLRIERKNVWRTENGAHKQMKRRGNGASKKFSVAENGPQKQMESKNVWSTKIEHKSGEVSGYLKR